MSRFTRRPGARRSRAGRRQVCRRPVLAAGLAGTVLVALAAIVRIACRASRRAADLPAATLRSALDPALLAEAWESGLPILVLLADPTCEACRRAREDLRLAVRPEDLGSCRAVLLRDDPEHEAIFRAFEPGLFPVYLLVDERGRRLAVARGYRPPAVLAAWIESVRQRPPP